MKSKDIRDEVAELLYQTYKKDFPHLSDKELFKQYYKDMVAESIKRWNKRAREGINE